ncbi:MAG: DUF4268 domain-containing protein, partial [Thiohalomonadaceae bacterium]
SKEEATRNKTYYSFWEKALPVLRAKTGMYNNVSPAKDNWVTGASGHTGITFNSIILMSGARAEIYIDTGDEQRNTEIYEKLRAKEHNIDPSFSKTLVWQDLPGKRASRICVEYRDYGMKNEEHWDKVIDWLASNMAALINAFRPLLDNIMKTIH